LKKDQQMICQNCGSSEFVYGRSKTVCLYCHSEYRQEEHRYRSRKRIWLSLSILSIAFLLIVGFVYQNYHLEAKSNSGINTEQTFSSEPEQVQEKTTAESQKKLPHEPTINQMEASSQEDIFAKEHIGEIQGWTLEKYQAIQFAQLHENESGSEEPYSYQNGTTMTELTQELGVEPDSLIEYTQYYPGGTDIEAKATWSVDLPEGHVGIYVVYEKESDQILQKSLSARLYDLHENN
jgi:hypothetical protein